MRLATRFLVSNRSLQILLGKAAGAAQKRLRSGFARFSERSGNAEDVPATRIVVQCVMLPYMRSANERRGRRFALDAPPVGPGTMQPCVRRLKLDPIAPVAQ